MTVASILSSTSYLEGISLLTWKSHHCRLVYIASSLWFIKNHYYSLSLWSAEVKCLPYLNLQWHFAACLVYLKWHNAAHQCNGISSHLMRLTENTWWISGQWNKQENQRADEWRDEKIRQDRWQARDRGRDVGMLSNNWCIANISDQMQMVIEGNGYR